LQQYKLSNSGSHLTSKLRDGTPLQFSTIADQQFWELK